MNHSVFTPQIQAFLNSISVSFSLIFTLVLQEELPLTFYNKNSVHFTTYNFIRCDDVGDTNYETPVM
jgi:hypothetical protein